jgi:hypothetical protein
MKRINPILSMLCISTLFFVLQSFTNPAMAWETVYDSGDIIVSFQIEDCHGHPLLVFKVVNNTATEKMVDFVGSIEEKDGSNRLDFIYFEHMVGAGSTMTGSCPQSMAPGGNYYILQTDYRNPKVTITMN